MKELAVFQAYRRQFITPDTAGIERTDIILFKVSYIACVDRGPVSEHNRMVTGLA